SVSEDLLETLGGQDPLAPFEETVGIGGPHPVLDPGLKGAELQAELPEHHPGFPFPAAFLTAFFSDLAVPAVDAFSQHGFELLQSERGGDLFQRQTEARQDDLLQPGFESPPQSS